MSTWFWLLVHHFLPLLYNVVNERPLRDGYTAMVSGGYVDTTFHNQREQMHVTSSYSCQLYLHGSC